MNAAQTMAAYESVLAISARMREAAQRADWDGLVALEAQCRAAVAPLMALGEDLPRLTPAQQARKGDIIRHVLADDAEIRLITEPWMNELEGLIGNTRNQRRLVQAYGAPA